MSPLKEYNAKRKFETTREPEGKTGRKGKRLRFVVQRHHASRLHYDFRLEMDGVLKSWAVPKGPSLYPQDKRLAVMVEDHPLSYRSFEGEIPKGNYGYGTVSIFDEGYYTPLEKSGSEEELLRELESGSLKVVLHGKKLKGEFALVRMHSATEENAWLLIKHKDKYAVEEAYNAEDQVSKSVKEAGKNFRKTTSKAGASGSGTSRSSKSRSSANGSAANASSTTASNATKSREKNTSSAESTAKGSASTNSNERYKPMLAVLANAVSEDGDWIFEQKLDGFRSIAEVSKKQVRLRSRNGIDFNEQFPTLVEALNKVDRDIILDGEVVAEDRTGSTQFQLLQHGEPFPPKYTLRYYVFDMLMLDGNDLRDYPLSERLDLLSRWLKKNPIPNVKPVPRLTSDPQKALDQAKKKNWEGVMAKDLDSRYLSGTRSEQWRKLKLQQSQEAIIVGYTSPSGSRIGFGALVLAVMEQKKLTYIGNVGTGFTDDVLQSLSAKLQKKSTKKNPFAADVQVANENKVTWVKPELVAEIEFSEWTADEHLRHPVFKALRNDKKPAAIKKVTALKEVVNEREIKRGRKTLSLTNQKKLYWPDEGVSKGELLSYYEEVAPLMLPYLKDKPISMNRFPNGIKKPGFFQKDLDKNTGPNWLKTVSLTSESTGNTVNYLLCNDELSLLWLANMGSIEVNPWLSSYRNKMKPVFGVLDLDPNGADFKEVVAVANTAHSILGEVEVPHFIKTSGSTGLHIYLHMGAKYSYDVVRDFMEMLAELVHEQHPDTTSLERAPQKRKKKIYLDYMQNKKGQTVVAPYSVRPKPGATVSTPLDWSEVNNKLTIAQFTMSEVLKRIANKKDPWATIFDEKVDLRKAIADF